MTTRYVMLSIQNEDGRPLVSLGVELKIEHEAFVAYGDQTATRLVVRNEQGQAHRTEVQSEVEAICQWLSRYARSRT